MNTLCEVYVHRLLRALAKAIDRYRCDCIALSGGIDTSVILLAAVKTGRKPRGYIAVYRGGLPRDIVYAEYIAKMYSLELTYVFIDPADIETLKNDVVRCIGVDRLSSHGDGGCIEVRNDVVFLSVLKRAVEDRCRCVYVGSGGDEVFAGYSFMLNLVSQELDNARRRMAFGRFPELEIARCIGVEAVAPLLDREVLDVALEIPVKCLRSNTFKGKELLREILSREGLYMVASRTKTPAESGAGTEGICTSIYDRA